MCHHQPIQCVIPPSITEHLTRSIDPDIRRRAIAKLAGGAAFRAVRDTVRAMPTLMASAAPHGGKQRLVDNAKQTSPLPGTLVRSEGQARVADPAVNEAYDYAGATYSCGNRGRSRIPRLSMVVIPLSPLE